MPSVGIYRPPAARKREENVGNANLRADTIQIGKKSNDNFVVSTSPPAAVESPQAKPKSCDKTGRKRRPDMAVYVPRGQRIAQEHQRKLEAISLGHDGVELQLSNSSFEDLDHSDSEKQRRSSAVIINDILPKPNEKKAVVPETTTKNNANSQELISVQVTISSLNNEQNVDFSRREDVASDNAVSESDEAAKVPEKLSPINNVVNSSDVIKSKETEVKSDFEKPVAAPPEKVNPSELDWDVLYDDAGECLEPSLMGQLTNAVGQVVIESPKSTYDDYKHRNLEDEFPHVVEVFNFPPEFKTPDLVMVFSEFKNSGFEIKWVDDTHALGIFSNSAIVSQVLQMQHPFVKTRCLSEGSQQSKLKARRCADSLTPHMTRPDTCAALARRLVTGALGVKLPTQRAEREAERKLLREAREKKKLAAKQRQEAWEGTFS